MPQMTLTRNAFASQDFLNIGKSINHDQFLIGYFNSVTSLWQGIPEFHCLITFFVPSVSFDLKTNKKQSKTQTPGPYCLAITKLTALIRSVVNHTERRQTPARH